MDKYLKSSYSQCVVFWIHPTRLTGLGPQLRPKIMNTGNHRDASEEGDDPLGRKGPGVSRLGHPRGNEELVEVVK